MNTYAAAKRVRNYLIERYALEDEPECNLPFVLTGAESKVNGFLMGSDAVHVVWEGGYEWPHHIGEAQYLGKIDLPGIFVEAATGYALAFYQDR